MPSSIKSSSAPSLRANSTLRAMRKTALYSVVGLGLVVSGCSSTSSSSSYAGATVGTAAVNQSEARQNVKEARRNVVSAKADLKKLERKIARAERRLKRKRLSEKRREALEAELKSNTGEIRGAKRAIRRAERRLARAERREDRADRSLAKAQQRKAEAARRFAEQERRRQQEDARAELELDQDQPRSRFGLFRSSDPALENVRDYEARIDNAFPVVAVPIEKMDKRFLRQEVRYRTSHKPGTIVVDTGARHLYLVQPGGKAIRYGIGVGKAGFAWSGSAHIGWKQQWPKWTPPEEMIQRRPELRKWSADNGGMQGGPSNPLGARALYLMKDGKDTLYRLHGTPQWNSIGTAASSGCIRLINQDVIDLYKRVPQGTKVVVI